MFIYNLKINKKVISKMFIFIALITILAIICFSIYLIFFKKTSSYAANNEIIELTETNYTNILKAANENIDSYVGKKVHVIGYVYRLLDFDKNQFVIARDMKFGENSGALVVGFLSNYKKAKDFPDGAWVEVVGEIKKGNFNGPIAILDVISIKETSRPDILLVEPPDRTFISRKSSLLSLHQLNPEICFLI